MSAPVPFSLQKWRLSVCRLDVQLTLARRYGNFFHSFIGCSSSNKQYKFVIQHTHTHRQKKKQWPKRGRCNGTNICIAGYTLRKQPTFGDAITGFSAKWRLRNERRNSILMTRHYPDLVCASDWLNQISHSARPIRVELDKWRVISHGLSALVAQTSFGGETSSGVAKCRLFSQAKPDNAFIKRKKKW